MKPLCCLIIAIFWSLTAHAEADGPDHFRVIGTPSGKGLTLHSEASKQSTVLGAIPGASSCLRNLGCQGGLSLEDFSTLSKDDQARRLAENPRWCKVEYQGTTGWVEGQFLGEGACLSSPRDRNQKVVELPRDRSTHTLKGRIHGNEYVDYRVPAAAGQTLSVKLTGSHPQNYVNVLPPGSELAMFVGSSAGNRFERIVPADGDYVVQVYLMRAAARRNAASNYSLQIDVTGKTLPPVPAKQDALIPGTPFHASASVPCKVAFSPQVQRCEAFVIRRGFDGTATLEIRWPQGTITVARHVLLIKGRPVSTDSTLELTHAREGDELIINVGSDEQFRIPDALPFGG
jgi:hypothetical protein